MHPNELRHNANKSAEGIRLGCCPLDLPAHLAAEDRADTVRPGTLTYVAGPELGEQVGDRVPGEAAAETPDPATPSRNVVAERDLRLARDYEPGDSATNGPFAPGLPGLGQGR